MKDTDSTRFSAFEGLAVAGVAGGGAAGRCNAAVIQVVVVVDEERRRWRHGDGFGRDAGEVHHDLMQAGHHEIDHAATPHADDVGQDVVVGGIAGLCGVQAGAE